MGKMRGTHSMGRGPGKTSMKTKGGSMRARGVTGGKGYPNVNRSLGAMTDDAPGRGLAKPGRFPAVYGGARKVASVKLTGPQAGMTEMTR